MDLPNETPTPSGTIRINRLRASWRDTGRAYQALVDETPAGKVGDGQSIDLAISLGQHEVKMKVDWRYSNRVVVWVDSSRVTLMECAPDTDARGLVDVLFPKGPYIELYVVSG